jgi:hypothetical protein
VQIDWPDSDVPQLELLRAHKRERGKKADDEAREDQFIGPTVAILKSTIKEGRQKIAAPGSFSAKWCSCTIRMNFDGLSVP